jgi:glycosyltransferase involved in cell wall biosynthesis
VNLSNNKKNKIIKKNTISVIVPVFNDEKRIARCIQSVTNYKNINLELIIIDDGSYDTSAQIADLYAMTDKRITVIKTENKGPSAARNVGIRHSIGEFIFFLDADDYLRINTLKYLLDEIKAPNVDLAVGDFLTSNELLRDEMESKHALNFSRTLTLNKSKINDYISLYLKRPNKYPLFAYSWGRLFKASIIKGHKLFLNEKLWTFEDVDFNFRYLIWVDKVCFIKKNIMNHTIDGVSLSASMRLPKDPSRLFGFQHALISSALYLEKMKINNNIKDNISHAYACYTIIQLIRISSQHNRNNNKVIIKLINECISDKILQESLNHYIPSSDDSKIIPFLIKIRQPLLLFYACRIRGRKRYGINNS